MSGLAELIVALRGVWNQSTHSHCYSNLDLLVCLSYDCFKYCNQGFFKVETNIKYIERGEKLLLEADILREVWMGNG